VIERLHPSIKGVWGAQTSGANIVSFNLDAFSSYGKTQSFNAPVGSRAAFAYTTALNHLLSKGSRRRIQVGDASTVFWAEKESGAPFETAFLDFLDARRDDCDPDRGTQAVASLYACVPVASLYACVRDGRPFTTDDLQRFHVLGLSPNAARIAIRFWHVASIRELATAFLRHFGDLEIDRPGYEAAAPLSLYRLLSSTALQGKAENIAPNLGGDVMRAILKALPYPETLMQGALRRIRAEREVGFPRAALLKAYLIRSRLISFAIAKTRRSPCRSIPKISIPATASDACSPPWSVSRNALRATSTPAFAIATTALSRRHRRPSCRC